MGGNYAPTFPYVNRAKEQGYTLTLHLDAKTHTLIDEFSTSNFVALTPPGESSLFVCFFLRKKN